MRSHAKRTHVSRTAESVRSSIVACCQFVRSRRIQSIRRGDPSGVCASSASHGSTSRRCTDASEIVGASSVGARGARARSFLACGSWRLVARPSGCANARRTGAAGRDCARTERALATEITTNDTPANTPSSRRADATRVARCPGKIAHFAALTCAACPRTRHWSTHNGRARRCGPCCARGSCATSVPRAWGPRQRCPGSCGLRRGSRERARGRARRGGSSAGDGTGERWYALGPECARTLEDSATTMTDAMIYALRNGGVR